MGGLEMAERTWRAQTPWSPKWNLSRLRLGSTAEDGSCFEAILRALSPLDSSNNAGCRRAGVQLGIMSFSIYRAMRGDPF